MKLTDGERLTFGDVDIHLRATAATTDGAFTIFEERDPIDTPLHAHENEDELFHVLEA